MTLRQTIESTLDDNQKLVVQPFQGRFDAYIETDEPNGMGRKGTYGATEEEALENLATMLDLPKFDDGALISLDTNGIINLAVGAVCCLFFAGLIWAALLLDNADLAWRN